MLPLTEREASQSKSRSAGSAILIRCGRPDGSHIYFFRETSDEPYYEAPKSAIYSVPVNGGDASLVASISFEAQNMAISPDGTQVAFRGRRECAGTIVFGAPPVDARLKARF